MTEGEQNMPLWRVEEAAEYLGIRPKTLYEWVRTGRVPHRKLGFNVRFDRSELERWVAQQADGGQPKRAAGGRPSAGGGSPGARRSTAGGRSASAAESRSDAAEPLVPDAGGAARVAELFAALDEAARRLRSLDKELSSHLGFRQRKEMLATVARLEKLITSGA